MRYVLSALLATALACPAALGQQPPAGGPAPAVDPNVAKLDEVLLRWENAMKGVTSFVAQCRRTSEDKTFRTTEVFEGTAKYLKSNQSNLASLEMRRVDNPAVFEKYVCSGTFLYEFAPQSKEVRVHEMPKPPAGQVADDNFMSFLFGMKATEAKRRYQLTFVQPRADDKWYYYIDIRPREQNDTREFTRAQLVLTANTFLPRRLWFEQPNGSEITWDFPQVTTGVDLRVQEFAQPAIPQGWQLRPVSLPAQPRVIRQQQ